jgi:DUF4097 and DUF4098 domain-containing protein YvlB
MRSRLPRLSSAVPLVFLALAASACTINLDAAKVTDREERRFTVSGKPEIVLSTFDGAIDVRAWDQPDVLVVVEKQAESLEQAKAIKVKYEQSGNRITIEVQKPEGFEGIGINTVSRSASVTVSLPAQADIRAKSGDGSITLAGVAGRIEVRSGDGGIKGTSLDGDLVVHTGDGSVALENVNGRLDLSTGDGGVSVKGALTSVKARTGDGSIRINALAGSKTDDDWEITTGDGPMTLELPAGFAAEVDAHTGDGGISVEGLTIAGAQLDKEHRDDLKGSLGSGGRALRLRTGDGPIRLKSTS